MIVSGYGGNYTASSNGGLGAETKGFGGYPPKAKQL